MNIQRKNWIMRHKWWTIFIGAFVVMVVAMFVTAKKVEKKNYVTMDITPQYTVIGEQMTETQTDVDEKGNAYTNTYPTATLTNTRSFDLKSIRVKDGETLVIGGMIMETDAKNVDKIPFLGDLPIIGSLFRSTSSSRSKSEMIVMITPKIIYDDEDL